MEIEVSEDNVHQLMAMGFPEERDVRIALRMARNDINEALSVLCNEAPVEMGPKPLSEVVGVVDQAVDVNMSPEFACVDDGLALSCQKDGAEVFPVAQLRELEGRVFVENWNIPYNRDESLGICLQIAIELAQSATDEEKPLEANENAVRFMERCLPECFRKLLTANAVTRWKQAILDGVYNMCCLLVELAAARLKYLPLHDILLETLAGVFDSECEYHQLHGVRTRRADKVFWTEQMRNKMGHERLAAQSPISSQRDPHGQLCNIINRFAANGGFLALLKLALSENHNINQMALLLRPLAVCCEFLSPDIIEKVVQPIAARALRLVDALNESVSSHDGSDELVNRTDSSSSSSSSNGNAAAATTTTPADSCSSMLRERKTRLFCLLTSLRQIAACNGLGSHLSVEEIDQRRLRLYLAMLQSGHFNARMNALKELTQQLESRRRHVVPSETLLTWMVEKGVLSLALEGHTDKVQFTDKIKQLVDFIGARLSLQEISKTWQMQTGQSPAVIDNIYSILAAAGVKFSEDQLCHLFELVRKAWCNTEASSCFSTNHAQPDDRGRDRLLNLVSSIGCTVREERFCARALELLWEMAREPAHLNRHQLEAVLEHHVKVLNQSNGCTYARRRFYVGKCVEDIKRNNTSYSAISHMYTICRCLVTHRENKTDKTVLQDLNNSLQVVRLVVNSLIEHQRAAVRIFGRQLSAESSVDGRYEHREHVRLHLNFLQYMLTRADLYLTKPRAVEIWQTLIAADSACDFDRQEVFQWFQQSIPDFEVSTRLHLFNHEFLMLDPRKLNTQGFACFKAYFEDANESEGTLKKMAFSTAKSVERLDLLGGDYLWDICLLSKDRELADRAIQFLLDYNFRQLSVKNKRDSVQLHRRFLNECYKRLQLENGSHDLQEESSTLSVNRALWLAATTLSAPALRLTDQQHKRVKSTPLEHQQKIQRLLSVARHYLLCVEESYALPRLRQSHAATYPGQELCLSFSCDAPKLSFTVTSHSHAYLGEVRQEVANRLNTTADNVLLSCNAGTRSLGVDKDFKMLFQVVIENDTPAATAAAAASTLCEESCCAASITVRLAHQLVAPVTSTSVPCASPTSMRAALAPDENAERSLPSQVMAADSQVYNLLFDLADSGQPAVRTEALHLLRLLPTCPLNLLQLNKATLHTLSPCRLLYHLQVLSGRLTNSLPLEKQSSPSPFSSSLPSSGSPKRNSFDKNVTEKIISAAHSTSLSSISSLCSNAFHLTIPGSLPVTTPLSIQTGEPEEWLQPLLSLLESGPSGLDSSSVATGADQQLRQEIYLTALQMLSYLLLGYYHPSMTAVEAFVEMNGKLPPEEEFVLQESGRSLCHRLSVDQLQALLTVLLKTAWAAAAGQLRLAPHPIKLRLSSSQNSVCTVVLRCNSGSSDDSEHMQQALSTTDSLCPLVSLKVRELSSADVAVSLLAAKLAFTLVRLRTDLLGALFSAPAFRNGLQDLLVATSSARVRRCCSVELIRLAMVAGATGHQARASLLGLLGQTRMPFWVPSAGTGRGSAQRLILHSAEYFSLLSHLYTGLSTEQASSLGIDVTQLLQDEGTWLLNFQPSNNLQAADDALLTGHLGLLTALITCECVDRDHVARRLVQPILDNFLLPAARLIREGAASVATFTSLAARMSGVGAAAAAAAAARSAAFHLLIEFSRASLSTTRLLCQGLSQLHHAQDMGAVPPTEWQFAPLLEPRADCGFVGLKNGGATCYMNAILQQLFMIPGLSEALLAVSGDASDKLTKSCALSSSSTSSTSTLDSESVLRQTQSIFGSLTESRLRYYTPDSFWSTFRVWGNKVTVHEQQDAFEFMQSLMDQLDDELRKLGRGETLLRHRFRGLFSDQKICRDCSHRYEREEEFYALNLSVKHANLVDSLQQFVRGELLEGDNAYFCEKCNVKRAAVKQMCVKQLPQVLWIQLKRFDYDWETNRALKFNDFFGFPWLLDMAPFTSDYLMHEHHEVPPVRSDSIEMMEADVAEPLPPPPASANAHAMEVEELDLDEMSECASDHSSKTSYELVGVVVHSGQANAGHYYAFIKERRGTSRSNPQRGKWFKFNDTIVEEVIMNDEVLEEECFGGTYKASGENSRNYPEERHRYWNAYLLVYERCEEPQWSPVAVKKTKLNFATTSVSLPTTNASTPLAPTTCVIYDSKMSRSSLDELTILVHKGEKQGIFSELMPPKIQRAIRQENLQFIKNRDMFSADYFDFVHRLCAVNLEQQENSNYDELMSNAAQLCTSFLLGTYLRVSDKLRLPNFDWVDLINSLAHSCRAANYKLLQILVDNAGAELGVHLLACPKSDQRQQFAEAICHVISGFFHLGGVFMDPMFDQLIYRLLALLDKETVEYCSQSNNYFWLLWKYATEQGTKGCSHMFRLRAFDKMVTFLVGPHHQQHDGDWRTLPRRWSSVQTKELGHMLQLICMLVINSTLSLQQTTTQDQESSFCADEAPRPVTVVLCARPLRMAQEMSSWLFSAPQRDHLLQELLTGCIEHSDLPSVQGCVQDMLLHCAFQREDFSFAALRHLLLRLGNAPTNELRSPSALLAALLALKDEVQESRIRAALDGLASEKNVANQDENEISTDEAATKGTLGLLELIRGLEVRRAYQCVKLLVGLCSSAGPVRSALLDRQARWDSAVAWLRAKLASEPPPQVGVSTVVASNESAASSRGFQRTVSAQVTLQEAAKLLTYGQHEQADSMN